MSRYSNEELIQAYQGMIACDLATLARVEARIARGVYARGPRKGQAYDEQTLWSKREHAKSLREVIAHNRVVLERAGVHVPQTEPVPAGMPAREMA